MRTTSENNVLIAKYLGWTLECTINESSKQKQVFNCFGCSCTRRSVMNFDHDWNQLIPALVKLGYMSIPSDIKNAYKFVIQGIEEKAPHLLTQIQSQNAE